MKANATIRKGAKVRISEIYGSLQGEGLLTGTPSTFVRTSGCNLRCWFCDTRFASWHPEGEQWSIEQIVERVVEIGLDHVVLTGGEPMIYNCLPELCDKLSAAGMHITIETAGTVQHDLNCDLMSISPKLSRSGPGHMKASAPTASSANPDSETEAVGSEALLARSWQATHDARREKLDIVRQLMSRHSYQLKFVVDCQSDADEVLDYLDRLQDGSAGAVGSGAWSGDRVLIMPQGTTADQLDRQAEWLLPWCQEHKLRFCPRAHIHWFGNQRGT
ncbi:MAG: 7-carboxy-7-deazaguanine synthase QueE [Aureliella sp.]